MSPCAPQMRRPKSGRGGARSIGAALAAAGLVLGAAAALITLATTAVRPPISGAAAGLRAGGGGVSPTLTAPAFITATATPTVTSPATATTSATATTAPTATISATATPLATVPGTATAAMTPTASPSPALTATAAASPTRTITPPPTAPPPTTSPTPTGASIEPGSPTPTGAPTGTRTPTQVATPSATPTRTASPSGTTAPPPTSTGGATASPAPSPSPAASATPTATGGPASPTATRTPTATRPPTPSPTASDPPSPTVAASASPRPTASLTATAQPTATSGATARPSPTLLPEAEATSTPPAVAAVGLVLPFAAYGRWRGPANVQSGIQIQNLSADPAEITVTFVDEDGVEVASAHRSADPAGAPNVYAPAVLGDAGAEPSLLGVRAVADAPIGAIVRTDWFDDGGAGIAGSPEPSRVVIVPSFVRRSAGRSTMLAIANAGTRSADVTATLFTGADAAPVRTVTRLRLATGTTRRLWADYESAFQPLGAFEGWLRLESDGPPLSVQAWEAGDDDAQRPRPVAAFEGQPLAAAASALIVPLFRSAQRGVRALDVLNTRIVVVNPGELDAEVTLSYAGADNPAASPLCRGGRFHHPPVVVPAGGRRVFRQAPTGGHDIPPNCFGTARITTANEDERVLAVVYDATLADGAAGDALLSAFNARPAQGASRRAALPLIRRNHVGLSTGIQVVNAGQDPVNVVIEFSVTDVRSGASTPVDDCTQCRAAIEPDDSVTFWPPGIAALADGVFGGAVVTADGPIVVLVNDYPTADRAGRRTDPATYLGLDMP